MTLSALLQASAERHSHLCPRQVLGVRMSLLAGRLLGLHLPQTEKRLLAIVETDGCAADGIAVATGTSVGHRTLRVEDFGKVAATFVDIERDRAVRVVPRPSARQLASAFASEAPDRWHAQLLGYQRIPCDLLLAWQWVELIIPVAAIVSRPDARAVCDVCGEEIINEREVRRGGDVLCRSCAGQAYCRAVPVAALACDELRPGCSDLQSQEPGEMRGSRHGLALMIDVPAASSTGTATRPDPRQRTPHVRHPREEALP